jgi:tellurite resistance protein
MSLSLENNREAFLAVLTVVAAADQVGSLEERDFLFQKVKALPTFADLAQGEFNKLLGAVTAKVYDALPTDEGAITPAGLDELLGLVKARLSTDECKGLVETAAALARSDGGGSAESELLERIQAALT